MDDLFAVFVCGGGDKYWFVIIAFFFKIFLLSLCMALKRAFLDFEQRCQ